MSKTIGIDLGTSNSAAAVMIDGKPTIIPSLEGLSMHGKMFPSIVTFLDDDNIIVGKSAKNYLTVKPEKTIANIKRKMGIDCNVIINNKAYTPQEISAFILKKIKVDAEKFLGENIEKAVISVPAFFNDNQRTATKQAGMLAGLKVLRIISEPTAASLAYGLDKIKKRLKIAVLDLGAGTFDITILEMKNGIFKVIATSGDTQLGGNDMDDKIINFLIKELKRSYDIELNEKDIQLLRDKAEKTKIELSSKPSTNFSIRSMKYRLKMELTREKLEELIGNVIERLNIPMKQALNDSLLKLEDIDKIILVGGPTRMPIVRKFAEDFFGKKAEQGIDPMNCVAIGTVIQGSILSGDMKDLTLLDVTPLSLGIETSGGVFTRVIKRNTTIPTEESEVFTTSKDNQTSIAVHVLQGERAMAVDNITLGMFNLTEIKPALRYESNIEVTFKIDANGILNVSAKDMETDKEQKISISDTVFSKDIRDLMIKEAVEFAKEDKKKEESIEVYNHAKAIIYGTQKTIKEIINKISKEEIKGILDKMKQLKSTLESDNTKEIERLTEELGTLMDKILARLNISKQASAVINLGRKSIERFAGKVSEQETNDFNALIEKLEETLKHGDVEKAKELKEKLSIDITLLGE